MRVLRGRLIAILFVAATLPAVVDARVFNDKQCGIVFSIPRSWTARKAPSEESRIEEGEVIRCSIALRPNGWSKLAKRSRWGAPDPPLVLFVFSSSVSYDQALSEIGFEQDEGRDRFGMSGGYGSFATAQPYQSGGLSGQAAYTFFRGFVRDESLLHGEESRVFSGEIGHMVLKAPSGRFIGFECEGGTPDESVDCESAIDRIARTIRFVSSRKRYRAP